MSSWWFVAPAVLAVGTGLAALAGRRLQREAADVRAGARELRELGRSAAGAHGDAEALAEHLDRTRAAARPTARRGAARAGRTRDGR